MYLSVLMIAVVLQSLPTVQRTVSVYTKLGPVKGHAVRTEKGGLFYSFLGIPYAAPPLGELRLKDPVSHPGWEEELDANRYGQPCPQWDIRTSTVIGDENCLTLNVFTPQVLTAGQRSPLNVMFWIHGGAFMQGGSALYGPEKLMASPIVLVTANYRLGVLGFLSTGDDIAPGNYGMMDIIQALHWIQDNIIHFGGDPQRVTIFGESSGAAVVSHLLLSPLARGLFWTAITQSGSALCDWALEEQPYAYASGLASSLKCSVRTSRTIVECLRNQSTVDLITAQQAKLKYSFFPLKTAPVVDRGFRSQPFMPDSPEILLETGNFLKVPLISGVNKNEGLLFLLSILLQYAKEISKDPRFLEEVILPNTVNAITDKEYTIKEILQIKNVYFKHADFFNIQEVIPPFVDLISDFTMFSCNDKMVKLYSRFAIVYMYVFSYRGNRSYADKLISKLRSLNISSPLFYEGVSHADDLLYLFNLSKFPRLTSTEDQKMSDILIHLWTTFAQQGNPNLGHEVNFWNSVRENDLIYLNLTSQQHTSINRGFRQYQLALLECIDSSPSDPEKYAAIIDAKENYYIATWALSTLGIILIITCIALMVLLLRASHKRSYSTKNLNSNPGPYD